MRARIAELEGRNYNVDWAKSILDGKGLAKDTTVLVSLNSELRMLPFLGTNTSHGQRVDFSTGRRNIEIWTPTSIGPQKRLIRLINVISEAFRTELECLHQVVYSPQETPQVIRYDKSYLPKGPIKLVVEILFDITGFQEDVGKLVVKQIRRRKAKFLKEKKKGIVAIDITHLTVVNPQFLRNYLLNKMTVGDAETLDGICLIVTDPFCSKGGSKLILIPIGNSTNPLSKEDFPRGLFIEPYEVRFAYALPLISNFETKGSQRLLERTEKGLLIVNGQQVAKSLAAEGPVVITGLVEKPDKLRSVTFQVDKKKTKISL